MSSLNDTPRANRIHIGFFGKTNVGKSSVVNKITGANTALTSEVAGTTTDPVYKSMELLPLGPVVLIDTAGVDDSTQLATARIKKTKEVASKTDIAVIVMRANDEETSKEEEYIKLFEKNGVPIIFVYNVFEEESVAGNKKNAIVVNAKSGSGIEELKNAIINSAKKEEEISLVGDLAKKGDIVILVMPQDIQAPKGRLILPQVQVMRELLDKDCMVISVKTSDVTDILGKLKVTPTLIITDSQVFGYVNAHVDNAIPLTSFSMLMAKQKGDIEEFISGAKAIASLKPGDKVLIAESCTHHAQKGDIAREKLPNWLNEYVGGKLEFHTSSGHSLTEDLSDFKLIVHCGGCMINRQNMLSKITQAKNAGVPITNFGVAIAFLNDIIKRVTW